MGNAEKAPRKAAGKMKKWIGVWGGSLETGDLTFKVLAEVPAEAAPAAVKDVVRGLGEGDYDTITGRLGDIAYHKKSVDAFSV